MHTFCSSLRDLGSLVQKFPSLISASIACSKFEYISLGLLAQEIVKKKNAKKAQWVGFEPTRGDPN